MKKPLLWSAAFLLVLLVYFVATIIFSILFQEIAERRPEATRTPEPTFTITPPIGGTSIAVEATPIRLEPEPVTPSPKPSATLIPSSTPTPVASPTQPPTPTATATPSQPQVTAATTVNIRRGPGINFPIVATLPSNISLPIVGQNGVGTWWLIQGPDGDTGWVSGSVVTVQGRTEGVPVAQAAAAPTAAPPPPPTVPPKPAFQYEPTGWFAATNYGLTRFLGSITDAGGGPVDGVRVEAQCGDFRVVSNPSGPVGDGYFNESSDWPPGFYDLTLALKPIPCNWFLTVVQTDENKNVVARLSDAIEVVVTTEESVITANWRKNW